MLAVPERSILTPASDHDVSVEQIHAGEAEALRDAWLDLANDAAEENYFYAPAFLLAAFRHLPDQTTSSLLVVWQNDGNCRRLIGLLPLMNSNFYWGLPIPLLHLWHNRYCSHSAPLLRKGCELVAARALLDGIARYRWRSPAIYLHKIDPNGAVFQALSQALDERGQAWRQVRTLARAVATPPKHFDDYLAESMSGKRRYNYRKALRDLAKLGDVRFEVATTARDVERALDEFMTLEQAGWKGDGGRAMASHSDTADFMRAAYLGGDGGTRAAVHSLCLNDRKIAINVVAKSGSTLWTPKIASDADFHKCAPGIVLVMDVVQSVGHALEVNYIDSSSRPGSWIEPYWGERRQLADVIVATTPATPGIVVDGFVRLDKMRRGLGPQLRETLQRGRSLVRGRTGIVNT